MCCNIEVTLPVVKKFLFCINLRTGCYITLMLSFIRIIFCMLVVKLAMLEVVLGVHTIVGVKVFGTREPAHTISNCYIFCIYQIFFLAEGFLLFYLFHLKIGIAKRDRHHLANYLVCRSSIWLVEIMTLCMMTIAHDRLAIWYLFMLLLILLEPYFFLTVYSYYIADDEPKREESIESNDTSIDIHAKNNTI